MDSHIPTPDELAAWLQAHATMAVLLAWGAREMLPPVLRRGLKALPGLVERGLKLAQRIPFTRDLLIALKPDLKAALDLIEAEVEEEIRPAPAEVQPAAPAPPALDPPPAP